MGIDPFSIIVIAVGAGVLGSIVSLLNGWLKALRAVNQPQKVVHSTEKTPGEIVAAARTARFGLGAFFILGVAAAWGAYAYYDSARAQNLLLALRDLLLRLIEMLIAVLEALHTFLGRFG